MLDETDIQKLLRLKRYEQPPPGYFDDFMRDFQRRQRAELLRQPAWKILLERVETFFSEHSMGRYAYSTATAAVLVFAGIASFNILNNGGSTAQVASTASNGGTYASATASTPTLPASTSTIAQPHYVIDSRPVSYERPFSF